MKNNHGFDDVVGLIYEAALDSELWPQALQGIAELGDGVLALLFVVAPATGRLLPCAASAFPSRHASVAHSGNIDPSNPRRVKQPAATGFTDHDFITEAEIARSALYRDHLGANHMDYVGAKVLKNDGENVAAIAIQRARHQGPFARAELTLLDRLAPHVLRALRLQTRFADLDAQRQADRALRDRLPFAVIVVDERYRIVELNQAAEQLLATGDGLSACHQRLRATYPADQAVLDQLIRDAITSATGTGRNGGGLLALRRPSLRQPLSVTLMPVPQAASPLRAVGSPLPAALVIAADPETVPAPPEDALQCLFGLTPAAARLAAAFAAGDSLQDYAEAAELSLNYVRWLLKQIQARPTPAARSSWPACWSATPHPSRPATSSLRKRAATAYHVVGAASPALRKKPDQTRCHARRSYVESARPC